MLTSSHESHVIMRHGSRLKRACDGNADPRIQRFSSLCERTIPPGETYMLVMSPVRGTNVRVPQTRHCAHCALTFFPQVRVSAEVAA